MRAYALGIGALIVLAATTGSAYAGTCNLTVTGSTCTESGARFTNVLPTGTFYVDPFLQIKVSGGGTEQGYNTTGDADPTKSGQQFQFNQVGSTAAGTADALQVSEIPVTTINGVAYREFMLAVNEPGGSPEITLEQLQIFLSPTSSALTSYSTSTRKLSGLTAIYDLDSGSSSSIQLSYSLGAAQGPGTMLAYIPNSLFTQASATDFVYLYSQFSGTGGELEEWWVRTSNGGMAVTRIANPEPGTLILLGSTLSIAGLQLRRRRRKNQAQA